MRTGKAIAYHGISNAKYALRVEENSYGDMEEFLYSKNIGFNTKLDTQDVYADNKLLLRIPSDQGYDGQFGTTAADITFEIAAGMKETLDGGVIASVKQTSFKRMAVYYEVLNEEEGRQYVTKHWALNVEFSKPNENHQTDTQQATIGEYAYPLTVYGEPVMKRETEIYRDANGVGRTALIITSHPDDEGYEDFGKTVPTPTKSAA